MWSEMIFEERGDCIPQSTTKASKLQSSAATTKAGGVSKENVVHIESLACSCSLFQ